MRLLRPVMLVMLCLVAGGPAARAQTIFPLSISGDAASAAIELPGGFAVDLSISFEDVVGLHPGALEVSARVVSPLDVGLLSRLPLGVGGLPIGLPVVLRIEPTEESALTMAGVVTVTLHTHNLLLNMRAPFGLYSATAGGPFREITRAVSVGSYRVDGSGGGFSEFLIALDVRPLDTIIAEKFAAAEALLTDHAGTMPALVYNQLRVQLQLARTAFLVGRTIDAIAELAVFTQIVQAASGASIPDVWRANDPARINVAGLLRAAADTTRFSLTVKANQ